MLALDDSKWLKLGRGVCPEDVSAPDLIRTIERRAAGERVTDPWGDVYSMFCEQGSVYPVAFAAVPHLARIARNHPRARPDVVGFVGFLEVEGTAGRPPGPPPIVAAYLRVLPTIRRWALALVGARGVSREDRIHAIRALVGLRHPRVSVTLWIDRLDGTDGEIELVGPCPGCARELSMYACAWESTRTVGASVRGRAQSGFVERPLDASVSEAVALGERLLGRSPDPRWPSGKTAQVVAALGKRARLPSLAKLAARALAPFACPACEASVDPQDAAWDRDEPTLLPSRRR